MLHQHHGSQQRTVQDLPILRKRVMLDMQIYDHNVKNYNNFPKLSENPVCHVRPHAQDSKDTC